MNTNFLIDQSLLMQRHGCKTLSGDCASLNSFVVENYSLLSAKLQTSHNLEVYYAGNIDPNLNKYALNVSDSLNDNDPTPGAIGIKTKLKKYYENITISSDFDGLDDPLDLFASPRMYPIMALYIANRLKWDLYRRYCAKPTFGSLGNREYIEGNDTIGPERGQTLPVDEGAYLYLDYFRDLDADGVQVNDDLNEIVKELMKQILDTNFINMVAYAQGWATPPIN